MQSTDLPKNTMLSKYSKAVSIIKSCRSALVAFSGGVDSALVAKLAFDELGSKAMAVTSDSPSVPRREILSAARIAKAIGIKHIIIRTDEFSDENYLKNPANRCYYCKKELYAKLISYAKKHHVKAILNGTNADDLGDYRPGLQAAVEFKVISPLSEAGITKKEVRELAKQLGLEIWDKPASPCLSSRIPYGNRVTIEKLKMVEDAENYLRDAFGIRELRVRHFGQMARIDIPIRDMPTIKSNLNGVKIILKKLGFQHITISDFKSGSLNNILPLLNE